MYMGTGEYNFMILNLWVVFDRLYAFEFFIFLLQILHVSTKQKFSKCLFLSSVHDCEVFMFVLSFCYIQIT